MIKTICLQAGHQNIKTNCDLLLRGGTGAPGEAEFSIRIRDRLSQILLSKKNSEGYQAFQLQLVDANFNCDPNVGKANFDLFLAIHYDADSPNGQGGCVGSADPSIDDASAESTRIRDEMRREYFKNTGIVENNAKIGANITRYYMWSQLSAKTPCVLIECGEGKDPHDSVILADTDRVCNAIARGICNAFNVPFDTQTPTPPQDYKALYESQLQINKNLNEANQTLKNISNQLFEKIENVKKLLA